MSFPIQFQDVLDAHRRITPHIYHSPCVPSTALSEWLGAHTYVKLDNLQQTGSFKERGACNRLLLLTPEERERGVICCSAGNHALGVSYHGKRLGIDVMVVMPKWAPLVKVSNCRNLGAEVVLRGENFDQARIESMRLAEETGRVWVPPFDDARIVAGAGTVALEILQSVPECDTMFVPVGGGGLLAGMSVVTQALRPQVELLAVESTSAASLYHSLKNGRPVKVETRPSLADGLNVAQIGSIPFEILKTTVREVVLVEEPQIASSILRLLEVEKTLVEGAAAITLAAAYQLRDRIRGKTIVLVLCGGNIDMTVLSRIIDRGLRVDGRLCRMVVQISDRPGSLATLLTTIASTGASIKEVAHDRHFGPADVALVTVRVLMETQGFDHIRQVHDLLIRSGYDHVTED
ncbi:MAG: threonine dehydratase [Phycisphaerae bacterium]|jgi:threonine dehydratase|nr:MAG: threonine dehydratase [Phycisphaerae bacterium]